MSLTQWQSHYTRKKSELNYPDENLVRLLSAYMKHNQVPLSAIDLGCGSGRHIKLFHDFEINNIIGIDNSINALKLSSTEEFKRLVLADNTAIPLKSESVDIAVAWGSLHYNHKRDLPVMLNEIHRILKKEGRLFATLRSTRDTMLKNGVHLENNVWQTSLEDISGAVVSFFDENELPKYFTHFSSMQYSLIERSIMGNMESRVSHWVVQAVK